MSVLGIDNYKTSAITGSVLILYDAKQLNRTQLVEILDSALAPGRGTRGQGQGRPSPAALHAPRSRWPRRRSSWRRRSCRSPRRLFLYTSIPTFRNARDVLFDERRLGVDVLDAIVVVGCVGTMQIFPGTVLCWCLGFGRVLVKKTQDDSKRLLLNAFGKQPRYVWLYKDGDEVQVVDGQAPGRRRHRGQHRRGRAGRRLHQGRDGHDRSARADRRVDARREGDRRPRLRLDA